MKRSICTTLAIGLCCLAVTGCASKDARPVSTATGVIAPSAAGMTKAQLNAAFLKAVPTQARMQPARK